MRLASLACLALSASVVSAQGTLVGTVRSADGSALIVRVPPATGARGLVPAYTIVDLSATRRLSARWQSRLAISNVLGTAYFTKRPAFYPGPGVWPSDGRAVQFGLNWTQ